MTHPDAPPPDSPQVRIAKRSEGPGLLVRALWFIFIGWWLTGIVNVLAYLIALTVIGLPVAFMIFNRLPSVLTPASADGRDIGARRGRRDLLQR